MSDGDEDGDLLPGHPDGQLEAATSQTRLLRAGVNRPIANPIGCLRTGADRFGWAERNPKPGQVRDGRWLVGMGMAAAFRNNLISESAARVAIDRRGVVTVSIDMTDMGTGSHTVIAQAAAEMPGVPVTQVVVRLGASISPVSSGSGGRWGRNGSTAGVYAACTERRDAVAAKLGFRSAEVESVDGDR